MAGSVATILGRDAELAALREVVAVEEPQRMLVLSGDTGIGKTMLWEAGVAIAREEGVRVLRARASAAEERLSYAGLSDLLDGVELDHLPPPQRSALEVALLREEPGRVAPEPRALLQASAVGWYGAMASNQAFVMSVVWRRTNGASFGVVV